MRAGLIDIKNCENLLILSNNKTERTEWLMGRCIELIFSEQLQHECEWI